MKWWLRYKRRRKGLCEDCGEVLSLRQLEKIQARHEIKEDYVYEVIVTDFPCLGCSDPSHRKRFLHPKWPEEVLNKLIKGELPSSSPALFGSGRCYQCENTIPKGKVELRWLKCEIELQGTPRFAIETLGECVHCLRCDLWQAHGGIPVAETAVDLMVEAAKKVSVRG